MPKAYFFRVGMDNTESIKKPKKGIEFPLGYVFTKEDNDFVYIPLLKYKPPKEENREKLNSNFKIGNKFISKFVCSANELKDICIHYDPCFDLNGEYSYGDHSHTEKNGRLYPIKKAIDLQKLKKGDMLIFCETLKELNTKDELKSAKSMRDFVRIQSRKNSNLYVIGYFIVDKITTYQLEEDSKNRYIEKEIESHFKNNAHVKEKELEYDCSKEKLILVKGNDDSRLLKKAIKIAYSEHHGYTIDPNSGFRKFIGTNKKGKHHHCYHFYKMNELDPNKQKMLIKHLNLQGF